MDQDCDLTPISCELRRIADLLAEPDLFDYLSGIVVPVILGVATVILAVFTITTANRANKLAVELEAARQAREDRASRRAIVTDLIEWAGFELVFESVPGQADPEEKLTATRKVREHRQRLGDQTLDTLQRWVRRRIERWRAMPTDDPRYKGPSEIYSDIQDVIEKWAEEPDSVALRDSADLMRSALSSALAKFEADRAEAVNLAADMASRARAEFEANQAEAIKLADDMARRARGETL
jgi:hypothetical protein